MPVLAVALLVVVVGSASATGGYDLPVVVSAEVSGSLGVVSTAQSEVETNPETEPRLVGRESSSRVDAVVISLWSIAAGMTVMLGLFLWHTSPRRRLRLARRRSTEMYEAEHEPPEAAAATASAEEGTAEVPEPAEEGSTEVSEAVEEGSAEIPDASDVEEGSVEIPDASDVEEVPQVVEAPASTEQSEPEVVLPPVEEEPVIASDLPPVWEDEVEQSDGEDEGEQSDREDDAAQAGEGEGARAGEEAEPARDSRTDVPPRPGEAAREGASRLWLRLRHTLGLD